MPKIVIDCAWDGCGPIWLCCLLDKYMSLHPNYVESDEDIFEITEAELLLIHEAREKFNQVQKLLESKLGECDTPLQLCELFER